MDEKQLATAAFQFLRRVQVSGDEAPTLVAVMQWLQTKSQAARRPVEEPEIPPAENPGAA